MAKEFMLTNFQEKVLSAIKKIPKGKVSTYALVARGAGKPKAFRAVGNALHINPYAPVFPCHRVVKSDGSLGGYAGGVKKKIALLKKEGVSVKGNKVMNFHEILMRF
jgi:methylated-DNA-[protein]-cysteine S-methyltransferase